MFTLATGNPGVQGMLGIMFGIKGQGGMWRWYRGNGIKRREDALLLESGRADGAAGGGKPAEGAIDSGQGHAAGVPIVTVADTRGLTCG